MIVTSISLNWLHKWAKNLCVGSPLGSMQLIVSSSWIGLRFLRIVGISSVIEHELYLELIWIFHGHIIDHVHYFPFYLANSRAHWWCGIDHEENSSLFSSFYTYLIKKEWRIPLNDLFYQFFLHFSGLFMNNVATFNNFLPFFIDLIHIFYSLLMQKGNKLIFLIINLFFSYFVFELQLLKI